MEQNSRNILFIDDHSEQYLANLEIAAKSAGFNLFSADNVLEGIEFLDDYATAVDAVILDLGFPKGEMQGTDALQKIKKKFAHLPVIMLTDSDTAADLERVVDCMKKGAYNYVGKKTLGQLEQSLVEALMGNVGSMIFFRPGINDYEKVRHYLEPEFSRENVLKLPNFNCISRLLIDNIPCEPFVFQNKYE